MGQWEPQRLGVRLSERTRLFGRLGGRGFEASSRRVRSFTRNLTKLRVPTPRARGPGPATGYGPPAHGARKRPPGARVSLARSSERPRIGGIRAPALSYGDSGQRLTVTHGRAGCEQVLHVGRGADSEERTSVRRWVVLINKRAVQKIKLSKKQDEKTLNLNTIRCACSGPGADPPLKSFIYNPNLAT